jgi:hypothetical protein
MTAASAFTHDLRTGDLFSLTIGSRSLWQRILRHALSIPALRIW